MEVLSLQSESLELRGCHSSDEEDNRSVYEVGPVEEDETPTSTSVSSFVDELTAVPKFPTTTLIRSHRPGRIDIPASNSEDESQSEDYEVLNSSPFLEHHAHNGGPQLERTIRKFPLLSKNYIINEDEESSQPPQPPKKETKMQNSPLFNFNFPQPPPLSEIRKRYEEDESSERSSPAGKDVVTRRVVPIRHYSIENSATGNSDLYAKPSEIKPTPLPPSKPILTSTPRPPDRSVSLTVVKNNSQSCNDSGYYFCRSSSSNCVQQDSVSKHCLF